MKSDFYLPGIGDSMVFSCKSTHTQHWGGQVSACFCILRTPVTSQGTERRAKQACPGINPNSSMIKYEPMDKLLELLLSRPHSCSMGMTATPASRGHCKD